MIKFHRCVSCEYDEVYARRAIGGEDYVSKTERWLSDMHGCQVMLSKSCTDALEAASLILDVGPGNEVIVPSYTFVASASAFALRGARILFADSLSDTFNVDPESVARLVSSKTRAIVAVHYGGVSCDMEKLLSFGIPVVEDAAHGFLGKYRDRKLGTVGALGCFSFHNTKNVSCGEGGALVIGDPKYLAKATEVFDRGTDRAINKTKYSWTGLGSSYRLANTLAAVLFSQLHQADNIQKLRHELCRIYRHELLSSAQKQIVPKDCVSANHAFPILVDDAELRCKQLLELGVQAQQHYLPLHRSKYGSQYGKFDCPVADELGRRLLRLPLHNEMETKHASTVSDLTNQILLLTVKN